MRRLEIGAAKWPEGHPSNTELFDLHTWEVDPAYKQTIGDARSLPYEDATFDEVASSQTLEHFSWRETNKILNEWMRVVKLGGRLILDLPDMEGMLEDYTTGKDTWDKFVERLYGGQDYEGNYHYTMFKLNEFRSLLDRLGYKYTKDFSQHNMGGFHIEILKT